MRKHVLLALGLLLPREALAADLVADPLTSASLPGRGSQGGSFGPEGWTTTGPTDAVWYEIPDALVAATVAFSVKGMAHSGGPLSGADHDLLAVYQAPTGQAEPIAYSPYFRNNDFKAFLRIFGDQEPGRAGAMKLELTRCPRGAPWYHDEPCTPECGEGSLAYANGMDKDIGWTAGTWYRIELSWGNGTFAFSRDGQQLATVPYGATYAPQPLRVRLGSPRHGISDTAFMPQGLTFKDVAVSGTTGSMSPVCVPGGAGGTGGTGGTGAGAGGSGTAGGSGSSVELSPLQDVTAASWAGTAVFDDISDLNVEGDGTNPLALGYLRFPAPPGPVTKAVLRVRAHAYASASGGSGVIHGVADTTWSETTMTWATRPAFAPQAYGVAATVTEDSFVEWDVTPLVAAGTVNFAIVSTDPNGAHFKTKEAQGGVDAPKLVLTLGPTGTGGSGGSGAGGSGAGASGGTAGGGVAGAGAAGAAGTLGGAGAAGSSKAGAGGSVSGFPGAGAAAGHSGGASKAPSATQAEESDGGCGCHAVGSGDAAAGWLAMAALAVRRLRRRSSR